MSVLKPTLLLILDGWGYGQGGPQNAIHLANTPNMDEILSTAPTSVLACTGEAVGLPRGQMGNSEVGHLNIGAGRIVYQDIVRIDQAIADQSLYTNSTLLQVMDGVKAQGRTLHLLGLVSDGGVHSQQEHIYALIRMAKAQQVPDVVVHAILDGRDTPPQSGLGYVRSLQDMLDQIGTGRIGTVSGRYYAMDRDKRWDRVALAYAAIVRGQGETAQDPIQAVQAAYERGETDEFVRPTVIQNADGRPCGLMQDRDVAFFFNFRADRARQMVRSLIESDFDAFDTSPRPQLSHVASMTEYDPEFGLPVAFGPQSLPHILGQVCADQGLKQLRLAETEKYAHVTYFFNGGREEPFSGEERILIPSPKEVPTYDHKPEMSVFEVTRTLQEQWNRGGFDLVVCNFANLDMVGHTGNLQATVAACEAVDICLGWIVQTVLGSGGRLLVTADHGNADTMLDAGQQVQTAHSQNPVPFVWLEEEPPAGKLKSEGILGDIAPTILNLWGLDQPREMTGHSLIAAAEP